MVLAKAATCCNALLLAGSSGGGGGGGGFEQSRVYWPRRPASLFAKQSPVPARRPLRCVIPSSSLRTDDSEQEDDGEEAGQGSGDRGGDGGGGVADSRRRRKPGNVSSKWASLFEAAGTTSSSGDSTDAWFDKIFPKTSPELGSGPGSSRLNAQQERSIQQLQSLVKTLGVATRNTPPPPARKNKPGKIRQLPVEGGVIDPVPFASILKKLQAVGQESRLQQQDFARSSSKAVELELGMVSSTSSSSGASRYDESTQASKISTAEEEGDEEEEQEQEVDGDGVAFSGKVPVLEMNELSKLTVTTLRGMAKSKGLSGYSRLRKDDLVSLLAGQQQK